MCCPETAQPPPTLTARPAVTGTSFRVMVVDKKHLEGEHHTTPGRQELLSIPNSNQRVKKHLRAWRPPSRD